MELLLEDAVLFDEIEDHVGLPAVSPGGERREEELKLDGIDLPGRVSDGWKSLPL